MTKKEQNTQFYIERNNTKFNQNRIGVWKDLYEVETNVIIFEKIRIDWDKLIKLNDNDFMLFLYLKNCAVVKSIIYLGRIYDNDTRSMCLKNLLASIKQEKIETLLPPEYWNKFKIKYGQLFSTLDNEKEPLSVCNFIDRINHHVLDQKNNEDSLLRKLIDWRNKKIAHNEPKELELLEFDLINYIKLIPIAILDFLNEFYDSGSHLVLPTGGNTYFINMAKEKYLNGLER